MKKLETENDIWCVTVKPSDIEEAINYATISLPWTFDRMRYGQAKQKGMNRRLINIMKGVLNQTLLERVLTKKGYECSKDWTNYRQSDIFDFSLNNKVYDVKTGHIYSEYSENSGRAKFSPKLLIKYKDYPGPKWKTFFPVGVTLSQINCKNQKDGYIFGIVETYKDVNKIQPTRNDQGFWCTVPYGKASIFFHNKYLIKAREEENRGFYIEFSWNLEQQRLFSSNGAKIEITIFGDWDGDKQTEKIIIKPSQTKKTKKQYSSLSCIKIEHPYELNEYDRIIVKAENKLRTEIPKPTDPLVNLNDAEFEWIIDKTSFINLNVPDDYKVYWIGHIPYQEFFEKFQNYICYFIPLPGREENQEGSLTPDFIEKLEVIDRRKKKCEEEGLKVVPFTFMSLIKGQKFKGGLLMAQQSKRGPTLGAASYIYPPQPGAFPESALYVLTKDLYRMEDL